MGANAPPAIFIVYCAALQQFVLGIDDFQGPGRVFAQKILHHDNVGRLAHREIRLGGYDHSKRLQIGGRIEFGVSRIRRLSA